MKDVTDFTDPEHEQEHRYCPICDAEIRVGSPLHKCSKKELKKLEKISRSLNTEEDVEEERTFDDRLKEYEENFDNNNYYEVEEEE